MEQDHSPVLLRARDIGKTFGSVRVLAGVSFDLRAGEVHILAGENGAGKSTFIKILAGVYKEHEGEVERDAGGIAVIHQELSLIGSLSAEENIFLAREPSRFGVLDRATRRARALELCRSLELDIDLAAPVERYPMSVRNRIEIAKALSQDARVIIMDEPTSALTELERERFFALIGRLKQRGCGIVYISHKMDEIYRLADRITVLRDGRHVGTAAASDLSQESFVRWMIGRELGSQFPAPSAELGRQVFEVTGFSVPNRARDAAEARPWLVDQVSFGVRAGEIVGLTGLQGSGASELLQGLFGGYGREVSGEVRLGGERFEVRSPRVSIDQGLALLTSDRKGTGLVTGMSIRENINLSARLPLAREAERAREQARALRIRSSSIEQEVAALSGGNQQKVVLAKWLETAPRVLLLDEPTRGVDVGAKQEIYALLRELTARGMAIVLISTELPELLGLSDRVLVLHRGRLAAGFDRSEATQEKILRAAMGERAA